MPQYRFQIDHLNGYKFGHNTQENNTDLATLEACKLMGVEKDDITLLEKVSDLDLLRDKLPKELFAWASGYAYEQGHAYGEEEVNSILKDIVYGLSSALKEYELRK